MLFVISDNGLNSPGIDSYDLYKLLLSTEEAIYRTSRSCYISECYAVDKKWSEAVSLSDLAEALAAAGEHDCLKPLFLLAFILHYLFF
jgi:hypothetical protein